MDNTTRKRERSVDLGQQYGDGQATEGGNTAKRIKTHGARVSLSSSGDTSSSATIVGDGHDDNDLDFLFTGSLTPRAINRYLEAICPDSPLEVVPPPSPGHRLPRRRRYRRTGSPRNGKRQHRYYIVCKAQY